MALALGTWLACTVLGVFLIDLDYGPSLVSLPMHHGVSLMDAMGGAFLVAGWSTAVATARRRASLFNAPGRLPSIAALVASCAGLLIAALLVPDFAGRKFVVGAFVVLVEAAAAAVAVAKPE